MALDRPGGETPRAIEHDGDGREGAALMGGGRLNATVVNADRSRAVFRVASVRLEQHSVIVQIVACRHNVICHYIEDLV